MALSLADLVACSCMLTANMLIREAYNGYTKGEKAMVPQLLVSASDSQAVRE